MEKDVIELVRTPGQAGNLIRRVRKKLRWSQTTLGERSGFRQETISQIENGNPATKIETFLSILAALDLELLGVPKTKGRASDFDDLF